MKILDVLDFMFRAFLAIVLLALAIFLVILSKLEERISGGK